VCGIICALLVFYIVAIIYAYKAYKEFKGIAEDSNDSLAEGANIMAYGTIVP